MYELVDRARSVLYVVVHYRKHCILAFFSRLDSESDWITTYQLTVETRSVANEAVACAKLKTPAPAFVSTLDAESDWFVESGTLQELDIVGR